MYVQEVIMKGFLILTLTLGIASIAFGQVGLQVYEADGVTPFDCNSETMVGDKRVLVLSSDSNDYWSGGLFIEGPDRILGILAGRDKDPNSRDWTGSHYPDAGDYAIVTQWQDSDMWGYDLFTFYPAHSNSVDNDNNTTVPGDWFVVDYYATKTGECNVGFYEYNDYTTSWTEPNYLITFSNVPTRDLNSDDVVNFLDFAIFASKWNDADCNDPNWCQGADIDRDGNVDYNDLSLFVEYWLWPNMGEESNEPNSPQEPNYPADPNFIYSIVDANGNSEITLDVNESITLYVDIATANDVNGIYAFHVEADISDTNLGSIDNTEYPDGTAQILAEPNKDPSWDYWKPGLEQEEGIQLSGFTTGCAIADGHLASFVFTCEGSGDVTLTLINWASWNTDSEEVFPKLEGILIHQVDPYSQQMMESGGAAAQSAPPPEDDVNELIDWLEDLWSQEKEIRETYSKKEWDEFIDSLRDL
jgi:hypothetical protein